jgi:hypothetical protein
MAGKALDFRIRTGGLAVGAAALACAMLPVNAKVRAADAPGLTAQVSQLSAEVDALEGARAVRKLQRA